MSKQAVFIILTVIAAGLVPLGLHLEPGFLADFWSQAFLLVVGTLLTTFVLQSVLDHDRRRRDRASNAFAFRSFAAHMLGALHEMAGLKKSDETLFEAALMSDAQFKTAATETAARISQSRDFEPQVYLKQYLNVAEGLRSFAQKYVRLFSRNQKEMLANYRELNDLAVHWRYVDEFSESSHSYTRSMRTDDPDKAVRENRLAELRSAARETVVRTAEYVAKLAEKNATGRPFQG